MKEKRISLGMAFRSGWRLPVYLLAALLPTLILAVSLTVHFINTQLNEENRILSMGFNQVGNQLSYMFNASNTLAQNLSVNTTLTNKVLTSHAEEHDFITLKRNINALHQLADSMQTGGVDASVRFYLPVSQIIPDDVFLFSVDHARSQPWYQDFADRRFEKKWYVTHQGKTRYLSYVYPLQNPHNFLEITGFLSVDVSVAAIEALFNDSMAIPGTMLALTDENGVIFPTDEADDLQSEIAALQRAEIARTGSVKTLAGKAYTVFASPVEASSMTLLCCVPRGAMSESLQRGYYTQLFLMLVEVVLLVVICFFFASSIVRRQKSDLKMLNYQINPHFLYNTLDMINWHAIDQDIPTIYQPIQALSRFYKIMLNHGEEYITLADELMQVKLYLELQNMRFHDGISYTIDAPAGLRGCRMLHLVLQPIVENAVVHGVRESGKQRGRVEVHCTVEKNVLHITVQDDGVGIPEQMQKHMLSRSSSKGYGLSNVHQRIRLLYGAAYGLSIQSRQGEGTCVSVALPIKWDEDSAELPDHPIHYSNRGQ